MIKMRLDIYLTQNRFTDSRSKSKVIIDAGRVSVNGKTITKSSYDICDGDKIEVSPSDTTEYVGRGGIKLEKALEAFDISPSGLVCADIGASTGGFTECLLNSGAKKVYAVDSGKNQLAIKLRNDKRVVSMEGTNARTLDENSFEEKVSLVVMDVSFISQTLLYPAIKRIINTDCDIVTLVKPQFEAGKENIGKHGIVKDEKIRKKVLENVIESAKSFGFTYIEHTESPIKGGDGNTEYLLHLKS